MTLFLLVVAVVSVLAGATAAVVGFGIGSLLTPLVAINTGMPVAVALVALPHAAATALRLWRLRRAVDIGVLRGFGVLSAAGGLLGALLYTRMSGRALTIALALLLILTGVGSLARWSERWHPGQGALPLGALSGFFGGLAGNQGGVRAAALLTFGLTPAAFVATSTAVGMIVDVARTPVYLARAGDRVLDHWPVLVIAAAGVLIGTVVGERVLLRLPADRFRRIVAVAVLLLGVWLLGGVLSGADWAGGRAR